MIDLLTRRRAMMAVGKQPPLPYDAEVEFIKSTGTQYISLPLNASAGDTLQVEMDFKLPKSNTTTNSFLLGHYNQFYMRKYSNDTLTSFIGADAESGGIDYVADSHCNILLSTEGERSSSGTYTPLPRVLTSAITSVGIFKAVGKTNVNGFTLYSCKWTLNGNLIYDLIPVRVGQVGYLYDKVSGELFGNDGSNDFIIGGDIGETIASGYKRLSFIEDVTKGILTDINAVGSGWEIDVQSTSTPSSIQLVICSDDYGGHWFSVSTSGYFSLGTDFDFVEATTRGVFNISFTSKTITVTYNGVTKSRTHPSREHGSYVSLFNDMSQSAVSYLYTGRCFGAKCLSGGNFEGVPAIRESDKHSGLYDISNNTFYDLS